MEYCVGCGARFCRVKMKCRRPSLTFFREICENLYVYARKAWNHDLFLTDDFLGQVVIPLKEVPVQEWNEQGGEPCTGVVLRCRLLVLATLRISTTFVGVQELHPSNIN